MFTIIENNLENKAIFFEKYLLKKCLRNNYYSSGFFPQVLCDYHIKYIKECYFLEIDSDKYNDSYIYVKYGWVKLK